jgi:hypothetical protein
MNGKVHTTEELPVPPDLINPFVHHLELSTTYDKIKVSTFIIKHKNLALKRKRMPDFRNG